jgi:hypothetical protein
MPAAAARARASSSVSTRPATRRSRPAPQKRPVRGAPPKRRSATRRTAAPKRAHPGLIPAAVGRVGTIADSGLMVRMTRSRAWIGVLATLLAGIVTLNVVSLSYTASSGRVAARSDAVARDNALLRAKLTKDLSGPRVEDVAAANGLLVPAPGEVDYLSAGDEYAEVAARRIETGLLTASSATEVVTPPAETTIPTAAPATAPVPAPTP